MGPCHVVEISGRTTRGAWRNRGKRNSEVGAIPTLFTQIIQREIPADIVYEDEHCVAFRDINPQAPVHVLIVPRQEISGVAAVPQSGDHQHLLNAARAIAEQLGVSDSYRLVINQGMDAGQTVDHLHVHLLAGRKFGWPPG